MFTNISNRKLNKKRNLGTCNGFPSDPVSEPAWPSYRTTINVPLVFDRKMGTCTLFPMFVYQLSFTYLSKSGTYDNIPVKHLGYHVMTKTESDLVKSLLLSAVGWNEHHNASANTKHIIKPKRQSLE